MMNPDRLARDTTVEAAIARVLDAENMARDAVRGAELASATTIEAARGTARAIAERSERRIRRVRAVFEAHTSNAVAMLAAAADAASAAHDLTDTDLARLDTAVASLAALLTEGRTQ